MPEGHSPRVLKRWQLCVLFVVVGVIVTSKIPQRLKECFDQILSILETSVVFQSSMSRHMVYGFLVIFFSVDFLLQLKTSPSFA